MEGWSQKEKGLMNMDKGVVIVGKGGIRGISGNEKYNKNNLKIRKYINKISLSRFTHTHIDTHTDICTKAFSNFDLDSLILHLNLEKTDIFVMLNLLVHEYGQPLPLHLFI